MSRRSGHRFADKGHAPRKNVARRKNQAATVPPAGLTPLDFLLAVVADENADLSARLAAARTAVSYVHPRRIGVDDAGPDGEPVKQIIEVTWKGRIAK